MSRWNGIELTEKVNLQQNFRNEAVKIFLFEILLLEIFRHEAVFSICFLQKDGVGNQERKICCNGA